MSSRILGWADMEAFGAVLKFLGVKGDELLFRCRVPRTGIYGNVQNYLNLSKTVQAT